MAEAEADQLKQAVERMHGGSATFAQSVPVARHLRASPYGKAWCTSSTWPGIQPRPHLSPNHLEGLQSTGIVRRDQPHGQERPQSLPSPLRARPEIIESTFDRVNIEFTTVFSYHIWWL